MKKIISIIIICLLIGCSFGVQGIFFEKQTELTINFDNINYAENVKDNCECNNKISTDDSLAKNINYPLYVDISFDDFPEYFNWKDHEGQDWTTPVKNQFMGTGLLPRRCGSCVVFAAMGALESVIKIREENANLTPDLSEQYVLSCLPAAATNYGEGCKGCDLSNIFLYITSTNEGGNFHNGVPLESCFPYQAKDVSQGVACDQKSSDWLEYLVPISNQGSTIVDGVLDNTPESIDIIKNLIMQHGPIVAGMETTFRYLIWGLIHHNPDDYLSYESREWRNILNHAVTLVGWKDDPSIGNGGYWICKNTIGTFYANNGFFNIEYGALFIGTIVVWVDYDPDSFDW